MNISNVSASAGTYQPPTTASTKPKSRADNDGDADDRAGAVSSAAAAPAEVSESGKLNAVA